MRPTLKLYCTLRISLRNYLLSAISYILMPPLKSFLSSIVECRVGDNVKTRFKSGHVRSQPLDWTKELECAKFGVNVTLATAKV